MFTPTASLQLHHIQIIQVYYIPKYRKNEIHLHTYFPTFSVNIKCSLEKKIWRQKPSLRSCTAIKESCKQRWKPFFCSSLALNAVKKKRKANQTFHASICNIALNEGIKKGRQKSSLHLGVIRPIATGAFGGSGPQIFGAPPNFVA